jgi:hypothetical protein
MKLKERIIIGAAICTVLFTLLLLVDLQLGLGVSGKHAPLLSHGRVKLSASNHGPFSTAGFKTRFLQRSNNASKEAESQGGTSNASNNGSNGTAGGAALNANKKHQPTEAPDNFSDLSEYLAALVFKPEDEDDAKYNPTVGELQKVKLK